MVKMFVPTYIICLIIINLKIVTSYTNECVLPNTCSSVSECVVPDLTETLKPDYYWREYRGIIPHDAIEGGQDEVGNTTFIGRIVSSVSRGVLPAIIYPGKREAIGTGVGRKLSSSRYVEVLCSTQKKHFEWKQISLQTIHLLTDYHLVVGGMEANYILYIGRVNSEEELKVGKVFDNNSEYRGLKLPLRNGSEYTVFSFEILAYPRDFY